MSKNVIETETLIVTYYSGPHGRSMVQVNARVTPEQNWQVLILSMEDYRRLVVDASRQHQRHLKEVTS